MATDSSRRSLLESPVYSGPLLALPSALLVARLPPPAHLAVLLRRRDQFFSLRPFCAREIRRELRKACFIFSSLNHSFSSRRDLCIFYEMQSKALAEIQIYILFRKKPLITSFPGSGRQMEKVEGL